MPYTSAAGANVYYQSHGEGPALLFAHGSGGHHAIWWQQVQHFSERFRVLTLDFPGFGNSDSNPASWNQHSYQDVILAVLDDAGVERAVLVAQSMGCPPSLGVAITHPQRVAAVVLAHSMAGLQDEALSAQVRADRAAADALPVLDRLLSPEFQRRDPERVFLFQQMGSLNAVSSPRLVTGRDWTTSVDDVRRAIAAGVFVCFLQGTSDAVVRPGIYEILRRILPEAHVETVEGAPHSFYWETPELFNAALDRILERALGRT